MLETDGKSSGTSDVMLMGLGICIELCATTESSISHVQLNLELKIHDIHFSCIHSYSQGVSFP